MGTPACKDCDGKRVYKSIDCQQRYITITSIFVKYYHPPRGNFHFIWRNETLSFTIFATVSLCVNVQCNTQSAKWRNNFQHVPALPRLPAWWEMGSHTRPWWRWQNGFGATLYSAANLIYINANSSFNIMLTFTTRWETSGTVLMTRSVQSGKAGSGRWGQPGHQVSQLFTKRPCLATFIHSKNGNSCVSY